MHFGFLVEVLLLLNIFLVVCADAAAAAGACAATTSVLEQREVPATVSSSTFLSFTLRCFGRLLLLLFLVASISVL